MRGALSPAEQLRDLAGRVMLGTARHGAESVPADLVLVQAAVLGARSRAGLRPRRLAGRMNPCPDDPRPEAPPGAMAIVQQMLAHPDASLIEEWAGLACARGMRVSSAIVPSLLNWWASRPTRSELVFGVMGPRAEWLATLNRDWNRPVPRVEIPPDVEQVWQTGKASERAALLTTVRRHEPARALALMCSTWAADGADDRRLFVEVLKDGRSMADEPFLEAALDDRSRNVRHAAARVLGMIRGSRLRARMTERARSMVGVVQKKTGRGRRLSLIPPSEFAREWTRDGMEEQPPSGMGKRAWWLRQVLAAADLSAWTEMSGLAPDQVLDALGSDDHFDAALAAFVEAAGAQADPVWCAAVAKCLLEHKTIDVVALSSLCSVLAPDQGEPLRLRAAAHKKLSPLDRWRLLTSTDVPWSAEFSTAALTLLASHPVRKAEAGTLTESVERASHLVTPGAAGRFAETISAVCGQDVAPCCLGSIERVRLRAEIHKEFAT